MEASVPGAEFEVAPVLITAHMQHGRIECKTACCFGGAVDQLGGWGYTAPFKSNGSSWPQRGFFCFHAWWMHLEAQGRSDHYRLGEG